MQGAPPADTGGESRSVIEWVAIALATGAVSLENLRRWQLAEQAKMWPFVEGEIEDVDVEDWLTLRVSPRVALRHEAWYRVGFSYNVAGEEYFSEQYQIEPVSFGLVPCYTQRPHFSGYNANVYCNPDDPSEAVLRPGLIHSASSTALWVAPPLISVTALVRAFSILIRIV